MAVVNTDWFHDRKWGLFFHYLAERDMPKEKWQEQVDGFDVEGLADQLHQCKAGYCFLTIGQITGHWCSPNETYDSIVQDPGKCSKRDLVVDLADALEQYDIPLLVYLPSHAPSFDINAMEKLKCTPTWDCIQWNIDPTKYKVADGVDEKLSEFQRYWEAIIREWSLRWGKKVRGWWFDGCYYADKMYDTAPETFAYPNYRSFAEAARAGNYGSMVAFNEGAKLPIRSSSVFEDFTAGEVHGPLPVRRDVPPHWGTSDCHQRWVDGAQLHLLICGDRLNLKRFGAEFITAYNHHINAQGGVVTWNTGIEKSGLIKKDEFEILLEVGERM